MLDVLRRGANTLFVKILLGVLVLSFAIWGIGDFSGAGGNTVAVVGDKEISLQQFQSSLQRELASNPSMDPKLARYFVIQRLVREQLLNQAINDMNLGLGEDVVIDTVKEYPLFKNQEGEFDVEIFKTALRRNGLTEKDFIEIVEKEEIRKLLLQAIISAAPVSDIMIDHLLAYRYENRLIDVVILPEDHVKNIPEPSDADLVTFHEANPSFFKAPEFRTVKYTLINCKDLAAKEPTQEELERHYENLVEQGEFMLAPTRLVKQFLLTSEEDAENVQLRLDEGATQDQIKEEFGIEATEVQISEQGVIKQLRSAIFETEVNEISDVVQSPLGWHIFHIVEEQPAQTQKFEEVKDQVKSLLVSQEQCNKVEDSFANMEDEFAGGARLEEVIKRYNNFSDEKLKVVELGPISMHGKGPDGKAIEQNFPVYTSIDGGDAKEHFLKQVYAMQVGDDPITYSPNDGVFVALEITNILPERVKALDELRGLASIEWKKQKASQLSKEIAEKAMERVRSGESLEMVTNDMGVKIKRQRVQRPSSRYNRPNVLGNKMLEDIFSKKIGGVSEVYKAEDKNYVFAVLNKIIPADQLHAKEIESARNIIKQELQTQWQDDIIKTYLNALHKKFHVEINEAIILGENEGNIDE